MICASAIPPIGLRVNSDGQLFIPNGSISGLSLTGTDFILSIGRASFIQTGEDISITSGTFLHVSGDIILCPVRSPAFRIGRSLDNTTAVTVAIGPGSFLLDTHRSISVIKNEMNHGTLILGDDQAAAFEQSCIPNSTIHVPIAATFSVFTFEMGYLLRFPLGQRSREVAYESRGIPSGLSSSVKILTLPFSLAAELVRIITLRGSNFVVEEDDDSVPTQFTDCFRDLLIDHLPEIVLTFSEPQEVVLYPEDYMRFDDTISQCSFNFKIESINTVLLGFNPLIIPNVNVHISATGFALCDSLVD